MMRDWRGVLVIGGINSRDALRTIVLQVLVGRTKASRLNVQVATIENHGLASSKNESRATGDAVQSRDDVHECAVSRL